MRRRHPSTFQTLQTLSLALMTAAVVTSENRYEVHPSGARSYSSYSDRSIHGPPHFRDHSTAHQPIRPSSPPYLRRGEKPPPYAVQMEPLVKYSQVDPLYHQHKQSSEAPTLNDLKVIKKSSSSTPSLPPDHFHKSHQHRSSEGKDGAQDRDHDTAGSDHQASYPDSINQQLQYSPHYDESSYYSREQEPIIEIIIQESNITLPAPPTPPPKPRVREPVQVFYVKYKKDPTKYGKNGEESVIYEAPIPAITPATTSHLEEHPEIPHHHPSPPPLPQPSTTLRTIIHPDSEVYHGTPGLHVTFGNPHEEPSASGYGEKHQESAPQPSLALPTHLPPSPVNPQQRQSGGHFVPFPTSQHHSHKRQPETFNQDSGPRQAQQAPYQTLPSELHRNPHQNHFQQPGLLPQATHFPHNSGQSFRHLQPSQHQQPFSQQPTPFPQHPTTFPQKSNSFPRDQHGFTQGQRQPPTPRQPPSQFQPPTQFQPPAQFQPQPQVHPQIQHQSQQASQRQPFQHPPPSESSSSPSPRPQLQQPNQLLQQNNKQQYTPQKNPQQLHQVSSDHVINRQPPPVPQSQQALNSPVNRQPSLQYSQSTFSSIPDRKPQQPLSLVPSSTSSPVVPVKAKHEDNTGVEKKENDKQTEENKTPSPLALASLPDEVPEELRQQLISSGILSNAQIQVLDYDKIGDIPIESLPPDALANFYSGGGAQAAGSEPVPAVVPPDSTKDPVEMKVVRYDPDTVEGQGIEEKYVKEDATQLEPVVLNDSTYNRYLPLKVSGAQFPLPDVPELKGRNVTSVVVLAPINYDFSAESVSKGPSGVVEAEEREGRDSVEVEEVQFVAGEALKKLMKNPTTDNYKEWLEHEKNTATDLQSIILLVTEPKSGANATSREIFMYDISTQRVSKLKGELSEAFVEVAEENANAETDGLETLSSETMERWQQSPHYQQAASNVSEQKVAAPVDGVPAESTATDVASATDKQVFITSGYSKTSEFTGPSS
uniref:Uncharacterized protein n=1 Tax=Timema tahoe TaxID=61484 RepID=A0A7R9IJX7_9NEOP|nr:unnamed protein product [Timema tahoe]